MAIANRCDLLSVPARFGATLVLSMLTVCD